MTNQIAKIFALLSTGSLVAYGTSKPNILILVADDQRADAMGCAGNGYVHTPNIDQLAQNGVRFTNSYVMGGNQAAICAPSRAMLMSGKSLFNVDEQLTDTETMPAHFAKSGYETFGTGKWHNGAKSFEASFQKGKNVMVRGMADPFKIPCQDLQPDGKLGKPEPKGYSTEIFGNAAIDFIDSYAKGAKANPFFCYVAFTAPHDPRSPAPDYVGTYREAELPLPGNFMPYHPFAFDNMKVRDENLAPWPRTPEIIRASLADYYAMITHLDKKVGEIIAKLKQNGLYENTIIVYAADNGLAIGSHGLLGKQNLYEHSMKVPLIFSGPGIPKGKTTNALVYLYDIYPTLNALCKVPSPKDINGLNLGNIIQGKQSSVRNALFTTYRNTVRAVRTDTWKLIRYPERNFTQLFNLKNDPLELANLATQVQYQNKVTELMALLAQCQQQAGDSCALTAKKILPLEYNPMEYKQIPDNNQNEYTLKRYFHDVKLLPHAAHDGEE